MMAVAVALMTRGDTSGHLNLYDMFEGMSEPADIDRGVDGETALAKVERTPRGEGLWCEASLEDVQTNLLVAGYPSDRIHFTRGKLEDTIPDTLPQRVALVRLDTDWYESTRHELQHPYALLSQHGVLIIDDYGRWQWARKAVDEYFASSAVPVFLQRVDYTAWHLIRHEPI